MRYATAVLLMLVFMAGCAGSPRSSFYTLPATTRQEHLAAGNNLPSVAIMQVTLPELVDRPQMVLHAEAAKVELLEAHRWAEPLKSAIPRILAEDISLTLNNSKVSSYPQSAATAADLKVYVDILHFERFEDKVILEAAWTIRRSDDGPSRNSRRRVEEKIAGSSHEKAVIAFSRALATISRDIAIMLTSTTPAK